MLNYGYRSERKLLKSLTLDITISLERTEVYYNTMDKYVIADQFQSNNDIYFERSNEEIEPVFTSEEIESIVKKCPNGKSCGIDGVSYEDLKDNWLREGHNIVKIFNTILVNQKFSTNGVELHSLVQRIPKKNFDVNDLTTLRDISLLSVCYKVFSKAICNRMLPYISDVISFWQRAFLNKRDSQDLIFTLKTEIDDFKHLSTKFYEMFSDFADAFGSVKHDFIFQTLEKFSIPTYIGRITEDLYRDSCFEVISCYLLSKRFYITRGTKTGDPLSAFLFIMVIDVVCKPMLSSALISLNLHDETRLNTIPIQAGFRR